jgi:hypothetical protein
MRRLILAVIGLGVLGAGIALAEPGPGGRRPPTRPAPMR